MDSSIDPVLYLSIDFGRLPQDVASWVAKLLDIGQSLSFVITDPSRHFYLGIVDFRGSTVIECPDMLRSGVNIIVSLRVYIKDSAFHSLERPEDDRPKAMFNEGQETEAEQKLRERKGALLKLFDVLNIKPRRGATSSKHRKGELDTNDLAMLTQTGANKKGKNPTKTEIVGDGEEIEVEAGEDLSENELNLIYKKYVRFDSIVCCRYHLCMYQELNRTINRWEKWNLQTLSHSLYDRIKNKHYCE